MFADALLAFDRLLAAFLMPPVEFCRARGDTIPRERSSDDYEFRAI